MRHAAPAGAENGLMGGIALYSLCAADGVRHYSPHVWKAILALRHKGLEFDLRPVSFADIPRIAGGGFDSVPVLDDRGHRLGDSFGIALHLEAAHSGPSLFPGAGQQALARLVEHHCDTVLNPPLSVIVVRRMHDMMAPPDQAHFRAARQRRFGASVEELAARSAGEAAHFPEKLALMRRILTGQDWVAGEAPGFADHILFGTLQWHRICMGAPLLTAKDPVEQWFRRCAAHYAIPLASG
jgi:glutathione S-transferase